MYHGHASSLLFVFACMNDFVLSLVLVVDVVCFTFVILV